MSQSAARRIGAGASIRLGLFGNGLSYLLILLLGHDAPHWVVALGLLRGVSEGFYWSGFHLVTYDTTSDRDRDRYFGAQATASLLLTATLPPVAGAMKSAAAVFSAASSANRRHAMGLLDKAKAAAVEATAKAKEGVEDVQAKRELSQAYNDLGKSTYELIGSGEISNPRFDAAASSASR